MKGKRGLCLFLALLLLALQSAPVFAQEGGGLIYGYSTKTLKEADQVNPYEFFEIELTVPNCLGTIRTTLNTSEGEGAVDVLVIYVPSEKWDGDSYYSGITARIQNDLGLHIYSGVDTLVGWEEQGGVFLTTEGGTYSYDSNSLAMHFLKGPGLYTGLATFPFSVDDIGIDDYQKAQQLVSPNDLFMTAAGYRFVLLLNDQSIDYYLANGVIAPGTTCPFDGLRELLFDKQYIAQESTDLEGLLYFKETEYYVKGIFSDIPAGAPAAWYDSSIETAYNYGLMKGRSSGAFDPSGNVTVAECLTLAARIHDIFSGGSGEFSPGSVWYNVFAHYCLQKGIIKPGDFPDYNRPATRAQMAYILGGALPEGAFPKINEVESLPDVSSATPYQESIYRLYRAGVLAGYSDGSFRPDSPISRAETAAIVSRMIRQDLRVEL